MKKQIGVIFGSRSCEREVAIISAVQLMHHVDREKYDVVPVYIDERGNWYTGGILTDISSYKPFSPDRSGIRRTEGQLRRPQSRPGPTETAIFRQHRSRTAEGIHLFRRLRSRCKRQKARGRFRPLCRYIISRR